MAVNSVMNKVILGKNRGLNWGVSQQLEDLDFADICVLLHTYNEMYVKLKDLENIRRTVGLKRLSHRG
jgi:hypothetical protein